MNKNVQKTINEFEDIIKEATVVANEMLSLNTDIVNPGTVTTLDVFVEKGKLYVIYDTWLDAGLQVHIPLEFLFNNDWQEAYAAKFVKAADKKAESPDAIGAGEELMLRHRIGKLAS